MPPAREDDEHDDSVMSSTFMADLTAAMLAPIRDYGDAQAVVPIVLRGSPDDLDKVRHVTVQRADGDTLIAAFALRQRRSGCSPSAITRTRSPTLLRRAAKPAWRALRRVVLHEVEQRILRILHRAPR